jgi:hypothetical protein
MADDEDIDLRFTSRAVDFSRKAWRPLLETIFASLVVLAILYFLAHGQSTEKYETSWIIIAVLPVLLWFFFSGRITGFKAFGVELKAAIQEASRESIRAGDAFRKIEFDALNVEDKDRDGRIPEYKDRKVEVLAFELGRENYYVPDLMKSYINQLTEGGYLKWIIFERRAASLKASFLRKPSKTLAPSPMASQISNRLLKKTKSTNCRILLRPGLHLKVRIQQGLRSTALVN